MNKKIKQNVRSTESLLENENTYNSSVQLLSSILKGCRIDINCTFCLFKGDNGIYLFFYHNEVLKI